MIASEEKIAEVRSKYGRTIDEILAKESNHDLYEILGAIQVLVGSKICQKLSTTLTERMVFAFTWLGIEVQNGGFHQYFFNSAGDFWKDVLDGLIAIGDEQGCAAFRKAISIFPDSMPSSDRFARQDQLSLLEEQDEDLIWSHFSEVTNRYFSSPFPNWESVYNYVKAHRNEFELQNA